MFNMSEQQTFELIKRCEAIKEVANPVIFAQIGTLVQRVAATQQLSDDEVNQLCRLLNCIVVPDNIDREEEREGQGVWDDEILKNRKKHSEEDERQVKYIWNHLLLCNRENIQTVEAMRRCVKLIAVFNKRLFLSQEQF